MSVARAAAARILGHAKRRWEPAGNGLDRRFTHPSGWIVAHCGHPTANYPWACIDPAGAVHRDGEGCSGPRAFRYVGDAIAHAERHIGVWL